MGKSTKASMEEERKKAEACRAGKKVARKESRGLHGRKGRASGEGGEGGRRDVSRIQEREQTRDREGEGRRIISKLNIQI